MRGAGMRRRHLPVLVSAALVVAATTWFVGFQRGKATDPRTSVPPVAPVVAVGRPPGPPEVGDLLPALGAVHIEQGLWMPLVVPGRPTVLLLGSCT